MALTFAPPRTFLSQYPLVAATTPGLTRSEISATATNEPRALNTRTSSPVSIPRSIASWSDSSIRGSPARFIRSGLLANIEFRNQCEAGAIRDSGASPVSAGGT